MIGKYFEFHKGGESKEVFSSSSFKNYEKKYGKKKLILSQYISLLLRHLVQKFLYNPIGNHNLNQRTREY